MFHNPPLPDGHRSNIARSQPIPHPVAFSAARLRTALLVSFSLAVLLSPEQTTAQTAELAKQEQALQQLLTRLGLVDLQIAHLEQQTSDLTPAIEQPVLAKRLADLYATRLMESAEDKPRYDETLRRIDALIRRFPKANTTALQVMLLQADYNRAEGLITRWISDPQATEARQQAAATLSQIAPQLDAYQQNLNQQVEKLLGETDDLPEGDTLNIAQQQLRRLQGLAARATYFAAWANYYLAAATNAAPKAAAFQRARAIFRRLFGLEDPDKSSGETDSQLLGEIQAETLGLESSWRSRALIGLGLSEAACGDRAACDRCFTLLEDSSVPVQIRDQAPYWYLRALIDSDRWQEALAYAQKRIDQFSGSATQGQVSLCVALVRTGYGAEKKPSTAQRLQLGRLGLTGLARLGQMNALQKLIEKYRISTDQNAGFILLWIRGQQEFATAERSKQPAAYQTAAETLQQALSKPEAASLVGPSARCRYTLAWCYFRQDRWESAAKEFAKSTTGLKADGDSLAPEAAWMCFVAYRRLAKKQPQFARDAADALTRIARQFPKHDYAKRVDVELARLGKGTDPDQMRQRLEAIGPDNPSYESARYELCTLLFQQWKQAKTDRQARDGLLKQLAAATDVYLSASASSSEGSRRIKCCLLVVEAAFQNTPPQLDIAKQYLDKAKPLAAKASDGNRSILAEYHYRALQLATQQSDVAARRQYAQWLADHATGSPYEKPALVILANALDKQVKAADAKSRPEQVKQAYAIYRRLYELLGNSPDLVSANKNAQVILSKLAYYASQLKHPAEAFTLLQQLLHAFPRDRSYLRRAGLAGYAAGQFAESVSYWRTLLAGLQRGSDAWYEAKYYQLACLAKTDKARAARVFHQFQLLYPDLGGQRWATRFQELSKQ